MQVAHSNLIQQRQAQVPIRMRQERTMGETTTMAAHSISVKLPALRSQLHSTIRKPLLRGMHPRPQAHGWRFNSVPSMGGRAGASGTYSASGPRTTPRSIGIRCNHKAIQTDLWRWIRLYPQVKTKQQTNRHCSKSIEGIVIWLSRHEDVPRPVSAGA